MEFRIFTNNKKEFEDSGITIYAEIGLHWFVDSSLGLMPKNDSRESFREHFKIMKWCEEHCKDNVGCVLERLAWNAPIYYFASDEDATLFKLTWC